MQQIKMPQMHEISGAKVHWQGNSISVTEGDIMVLNNIALKSTGCIEEVMSREILFQYREGCSNIFEHQGNFYNKIEVKPIQDGFLYQYTS